MSKVIGWIIDKDHLAGEIGGVMFDARNIGQSVDDNATSSDGYGGAVNVERFSEDNRPEIVDPQKFTILDEDGEVYATGRMRGDWAKGYEEQCFAPLAYGTANWGATVLKINGEII